MSNEKHAELEVELKKARQAGDLARVNRVPSIFLFADGLAVVGIAQVLRVSSKAVRAWFKRDVIDGLRGLRSKKSPGRPPKLCKPQRRQLAKLIGEGPAQAQRLLAKVKVGVPFLS